MRKLTTTFFLLNRSLSVTIHTPSYSDNYLSILKSAQSQLDRLLERFCYNKNILRIINHTERMKTMFNMTKIGKKICALRKEHNMTQVELADRLAISYQAVSNWERGVSQS